MYRPYVDPWRFRTSAYERRRYCQMLDFLSQPRYRCAFEPGCSIGELTALLAIRCEHVVATEVSLTAARRAVMRCAEIPGVEIELADIKEYMPPGPFDLIVFSDIGYYFDEASLAVIARQFAARLAKGGELIAVHWQGASDQVLHGEETHRVLLERLPLPWVQGRRFESYRIDQWKQP